jgi:hypothetical protein
MLCVEINDKKFWIVLTLCSRMIVRYTFQPIKVQMPNWVHLSYVNIATQ